MRISHEKLIAQAEEPGFQFLSVEFPFTKAERQFFELLLDLGVVDSTLVISDPILQESISNRPRLNRKTAVIRKYKGISD